MASLSDLSNYSTFILDDEEIIIVPGTRFSKMELKSRLKEMNVKFNENQSKDILKDLYDIAIQDYRNRLKIISRLKKDTINMNSILNLSQRQSIPSKMNISNNNIDQTKMMNVSYDINNLYPNIKEKQVKVIKQVLPNDGKFIPKQVNINLIKQNNLNNRNYCDNNNDNANFNKINNNMNNYNYNYNNQMPKNNNINYQNNEYNKNNDYMNNNSNNYYNNQNYKNDNRQYEEINTDIDNNINNNNNKYNQYNQQYNQQYNKYNQNQYNERKNNEKINKYNRSKNSNNNINIIPESKYEYENSEKYINHLNKKKNDQINQEQIDITPEKIILKTNPIKSPYPQRNYKNNNNYYSPSYDNNQIANNYEQNNNKNYTNNPYDENIEVDIHKNKNDNFDRNRKYEDEKRDNNNNERILVNKDPDGESTFSFFGIFENIKKQPIYKNRKFILIHLIVLLAILISTILVLQLVYNYRESILDFLSNIFNFLLQPKRILDLFTSFLSFIIFTPIHYWNISLPLITLGIIFYFFMRKHLFKKRCKEIIEKIVKYLQESGERNISDDDIYKKIVKDYGISHKKFLEKYLPRLKKLRSNDGRLRLSSMRINEKEIIFWELTI